MIAALILGAVVACSLAALAWLVATAPEGFEDAAGFHLGPEPTDPRAAVAQGSREGVCPSPSALPADFVPPVHDEARNG